MAVIGAMSSLERNAGNWEAGLTLVGRAAALDPRSFTIANRLALFLFYLRRYPEAEIAQRRAESLAPTSLSTIHQGAMLALAQGDRARAERIARTGPPQLDRDRRAEMVPFKHGKTGQIFFRLGNLLSFGLYTHREKATPELQAQMELARRLDYHERYLREVARSSPVIEVVQDMDEVRASLRFIAEHGAGASGKTAKAVARIFAQTEDEETRKLSLNSLYRINNEAAKKELLALYKDEQVTSIWRLLIAEHLRNAVREEQRIAPKDAKIISSVVGL